VAVPLPKRSGLLYAIAVWTILNIALMALLISNGDWADLNNWIEIGLWATALPALLSAKKWGFAYVIVVLAYTLSTSVGILIYYQIWLNAARLINIPLIIYLFRSLFDGKTR